MSEDTPQPPGSPPLPTANDMAPLHCKFHVEVQFDNNQVGKLDVLAIDHIGALVKLAAFLSDQPARVTKMTFQDTTGQRILPVVYKPRF